MSKILIVEDDDELQFLLKVELTESMHTVEAVGTGEEALELLAVSRFDLVILDISLPGISGFEVCEAARKDNVSTPILMLTGKLDITDKTAGLDCGADDYLTKPFDVRELQARIRALLRRAGSAHSNKLKVRNITLNLDSREVTRDDTSLKLLPREFALLEFFMLNPNKVFSAEALIDHVWQSDKAVTLSNVYTTIKTLRDKISKRGNKDLIVNVHGVGYKLVP